MSNMHQNMRRSIASWQTVARMTLLIAAMGGLTFVGQNSAVAQINVGDPADIFGDPSLDFLTQSETEATFSAEYSVPSGSNEGELRVTADIIDGWHIYSLTQEKGGPQRTKLAIQSPDTVKVLGDFKPDQPPKKVASKAFSGITEEKHEHQVVWSAPIRVPDGFRGDVTVALNGQVCAKADGGCIPLSEKITASFVSDESNTAAAKPKVKAKPFRDEDYVVEWTATAPQALKPGQRGTLKFTATPDATFHIYVAAIDDAQSSTNFVVTQKSDLLVGPPTTKEPVISKTLFEGLPPTKYHKGKVAWTLPIQVPTDAAPGEHVIEGFVAYQACTDKSCMQPTALKFKANIKIAADAKSDAAPMTLASAKKVDALDAAATLKWVDKLDDEPKSPSKPDAPKEDTDDKAAAVTPTDFGDQESMAFPTMLLFGFLGGVLLNVMPCVLPVVGLKVMSFVQQAGNDRKRVLMLNLVYVAGIMFVFAILAVMAASLAMSWGQQFTYFPVKLALTLLLFAMALSYLGVWEIPTPGMASGKGSQQLQSREGYSGAFFKGVFATILATPCSGPLLGSVLSVSITLSPLQTIIVIMTVGLGMSLPYIIIGFRPALVSWLPKPGEWMNTLKEFLAFLLLGTVAYFFNQFSEDYKLFVFVALLGVWFGCWIVGKVPNWETLQKRVYAWSGGIAAATVICVLAFRFLGPVQLAPGQKAIEWQKYDEARLAELQREGRTVLIDFTAKWCPNCIVNYKVAINTEKTRQVLEELNAVAMLADWTDYDDDIKQKLTELRSRSIPLLAIYPGQSPEKPIVLRDLVSQTNVVDALRQAGASVQDDSGSNVAGSDSQASAANQVVSLAH